MKKTYTIIDFPNDGEKYGSYTSVYPSEAASKALTSLSKIKDISNTKGNYIIFSIINKADKNEKVYTYIGTRIQLENPIQNNKIVYKYKNIVSRYKNI